MALFHGLRARRLALLQQVEHHLVERGAVHHALHLLGSHHERARLVRLVSGVSAQTARADRLTGRANTLLRRDAVAAPVSCDLSTDLLHERVSELYLLFARRLPHCFHGRGRGQLRRFEALDCDSAVMGAECGNVSLFTFVRELRRRTGVLVSFLLALQCRLNLYLRLQPRLGLGLSLVTSQAVIWIFQLLGVVPELAKDFEALLVLRIIVVLAVPLHT